MLLVVLAAPAWAGPKRPPSALSGEDDPQPLRARGSAKPNADLALLRALTWAFEPAPTEVRVLAIEDLGLLGDPRALNALAHLSLDGNLAVAKAAIRAIGAIRHPRAEEILRNIVLHPSVAEPAKAYAMQLVPLQTSRSALRFVRHVASSATYPGGVLAAARRMQGDLPPEPTP